MIRINHPRLDEWARSLYDDFFVKEGYQNLLQRCTEETFWNADQKDFLHFLLTKSETLISGRPAQLAELSRYIRSTYKGKRRVFNVILNPKTKVCHLKTMLQQIFNYNNFIGQYNPSKWGAYSLAEKLQVAVCPYCNRQFTTTYQSINGRTRPQLDHFFDKATYPYLAVSFFNLIPSCYVCNSNLKGKKAFSLDTHLHPYDEGFEGYRRFTVKFEEGKDIDYVGIFEGNVQGFTIGFKDNSLIDKSHPFWEKARGNTDVFKLIELYNTHKDYASDLILKSKIYNVDQIQNLLQTFPDLFQNESEVIKLAAGASNTDDDFTKRVLSKFTQDLLFDLKVLPS